jgi:hypothetical protein
MARRNIDPVVAHERAVKAGTSRTTVDYFLAKLEARRAELTAEHRALLREVAGDAE